MKLKLHSPISRTLAIVIAVSFCFTSCRRTVVLPEEKSKMSLLNAREFTLTPDVNGRLMIDNSSNYYLPGDILNLDGDFSAVFFTNLSGSASEPIIIRNASGTVTTIGNPAWNGGSWAEGLVFTNCHHIILGAETDKSDFVINGSAQPARQAYMNLVLRQHTDNFEIKNLTINDGGTGIWAKTDPLITDTSSWYPNSQMFDLKIHDVEIDGTHNEAMYVGHTATYWDLTAGTSYYGDPSGFIPGHQYVQPIKWYNVKIYDNYVHNIGADGIQTSAIDLLEVYNNEVTNWALQHNYSHNGGILIGGRTTNTNTHDNYVHNGWGELLQFYGSGESGATHVIHNNLFRTNEAGNDGVSLRPTANGVVQITNNTFAKTGGNLIRLNGNSGAATAAHIINANALIEPRTAGGTVYPNAYIYTEGGATYTEGTGSNANTKFLTVALADVDTTNYYLPNPGSPVGVSGYRRIP